MISILDCELFSEPFVVTADKSKSAEQLKKEIY